VTPAVADLLRGLLPGVSPDAGTRLPPTAGAKLPTDTVGAARVPAGVHLAFTGTAGQVRLTVRPGDPTSVPSPGVAESFVVFVDDEQVGAVGLPDGAGAVDVPLPTRAPDAVVRVFLPEPVALVVESVQPVGGEIAPAGTGPRWVVQGDSISQGWSVTSAGLAWPSRVARRLGLDLVNLGFAGSARGELVAATVVADSRADAVTLAWGTNCWSSIPTDARAIAEQMRLFLTVVRQGLPDVPVVVVSPIVRPPAESEPNRFGSSLVDLRRSMESAVTEFARAHGDERLTLVPGLGLVPAELLVDGVHPGDEGHRRLADELAPLVGAATGR
jgi:lysophospholipase L1-like esterase